MRGRENQRRALLLRHSTAVPIHAESEWSAGQKRSAKQVWSPYGRLFAELSWKRMSHAAVTLHVLLFGGVILTSFALPQYQSAIPNGAFSGVLTGHSSTSGGSRYTQLHHCAVSSSSSSSSSSASLSSSLLTFSQQPELVWRRLQPSQLDASTVYQRQRRRRAVQRV
jgi:hypothetical protein